MNIDVAEGRMRSLYGILSNAIFASAVSLLSEYSMSFSEVRHGFA